MLIMTSIIRAGKSRMVSSQIDEDSYSRIITCIRVLSSVPPEKAMVQTFLNDTKVAFGKLIEARDVGRCLNVCLSLTLFSLWIVEGES